MIVYDLEEEVLELLLLLLLVLELLLMVMQLLLLLLRELQSSSDAASYNTCQISIGDFKHRTSHATPACFP